MFGLFKKLTLESFSKELKGKTRNLKDYTQLKENALELKNYKDFEAILNEEIKLIKPSYDLIYKLSIKKNKLSKNSDLLDIISKIETPFLNYFQIVALMMNAIKDEDYNKLLRLYNKEKENLENPFRELIDISKKNNLDTKKPNSKGIVSLLILFTIVFSSFIAPLRADTNNYNNYKFQERVIEQSQKIPFIFLDAMEDDDQRSNERVNRYEQKYKKILQDCDYAVLCFIDKYDKLEYQFYSKANMIDIEKIKDQFIHYTNNRLLMSKNYQDIFKLWSNLNEIENKDNYQPEFHFFLSNRCLTNLIGGNYYSEKTNKDFSNYLEKNCPNSKINIYSANEKESDINKKNIKGLNESIKLEFLR